MSKAKNVKKADKVESKKETVIKYTSLVRFSGNRRGGDILIGQEVFAKDFGGDEALDSQVARGQVKKTEVKK